MLLLSSSIKKLWILSSPATCPIAKNHSYSYEGLILCLTRFVYGNKLEPSAGIPPLSLESCAIRTTNCTIHRKRSEKRHYRTGFGHANAVLPFCSWQFAFVLLILMGLVRGQMDDGEDDKLTLQRKDLWHQTGGPESNRSLSAHCFGLGSGLQRRQQRRIRNSVTRSILGTPGNGNGSRAVNHPWSELRRGRKSGERREGGEEKRSLYERC